MQVLYKSIDILANSFVVCGLNDTFLYISMNHCDSNLAYPYFVFKADLSLHYNGLRGDKSLVEIRENKSFRLNK